MKRRTFFQSLTAVLALPAFSTACAAESEKLGKLQNPRSFWKPLLTREQYAVLFEEDTEPPHSSPLDKEKRMGTYLCAACYQPLFAAEMKYDSGTGWPSFWKSLPDALGTKTDYKIFYPRSEYHCSRCGGHQGHVFDDGPQPTGLRYCNNGLALRFVPAGETVPALRG